MHDERPARKINIKRRNDFPAIEPKARFARYALRAT
jgi:hypothetical protein